MAHRIDIQLGDFSEDEHHKVRNFVEAVWQELSKHGWVDLENFDRRIKPGATFHVSVPARASHDAVKLVEAAARKHFVTGLVQVSHSKKAPADG
jgi:hypothetical protein